MEKTKREMEERILAEAEAYLDKYGLTVYVNNFLESEEAKQRINFAYEELIIFITGIRENAPKVLKEKANKLHKDFVDHKANFASDAAANFRIRIYTALEFLPKSMLASLDESGILKKTFSEENEAFGKDLSEIAQDMKEELSKSFVEELYEGFETKWTPKDIEAFLQFIFGS